jgi:hypothetical protein
MNSGWWRGPEGLCGLLKRNQTRSGFQRVAVTTRPRLSVTLSISDAPALAGDAYGPLAERDVTAVGARLLNCTDDVIARITRARRRASGSR